MLLGSNPSPGGERLREKKKTSTSTSRAGRLATMGKLVKDRGEDCCGEGRGDQRSKGKRGQR